MVSQPVRIAVLVLSGLILMGLGVLGVAQARNDQAVREAAMQPELPKAVAPKLESPVAAAQTAPAAPAPQKEIWVHVTGAVTKPGVYQLPEGARVAEALNAAGGSLPEGRPDELNLAERLADGAKVWIPTEAELKAAAEAAPGPLPVASKGTVAPVKSTGGGTGAAPAAQTGGKVNINTATSKELERVTGIGPATAAKIIAYREQQGPFKSVDDLIKVSGIGPATLAKMRDQITI